MSEQFPDFNQVIALHTAKGLEWDLISEMAPLLPRGWWELARLSSEYRIEFTHEFWQSKFPYVEAGIFENFFTHLEDIGIFAVQAKKEGPFDVHMVYTLKDGAGFFQGEPPASVVTTHNLSQKFGNLSFPLDYLAFLEIHDGFSKYTDTGMIKSRDMARAYQKFQQLLSNEIVVNTDGNAVESESLVPFYESSVLHCYQCFYTDWYPKEEVGNVFFSEYERTISDVSDPYLLKENQAFPTFTDWLKFYLEEDWHL